MKLDAFWSTPRWHEYERAYGDAPGTRAQLVREATWQTRVVDLAQGPQWSDVRKSYRSLIHRGTYEYRIDDAEGPRLECQQLHEAVAGRQTRPQATWDLMAEWSVRRGTIGGVWIIAADTFGTIGGYAYVVLHGQWGYYFSGVTRDYARVGAALQWYAIRWLCVSGVRWYELGWQGHAQDGKGRDIEFFKRGFGGTDYALTAEMGD